MLIIHPFQRLSACRLKFLFWLVWQVSAGHRSKRCSVCTVQDWCFSLWGCKSDMSSPYDRTLILLASVLIFADASKHTAIQLHFDLIQRHAISIWILQNYVPIFHNQLYFYNFNSQICNQNITGTFNRTLWKLQILYLNWNIHNKKNNMKSNKMLHMTSSSQCQFDLFLYTGIFLHIASIHHIIC